MQNNYKQNLVPLIISLLLLLLASLLYLHKPPSIQPFFQRLNALTYDLRMRATANGIPSEFPPLFIIDIDEKSLEQEGQWPWNRRKLADLIIKLHKAGSAVITLDITLAEPETNPVDLIKQSIESTQPELSAALEPFRETLDGDHYLAKAINEKGVILGYLFHPTNPHKRGDIRPPPMGDTPPLNQLTSLEMQGYTGNLTKLANAAAQNGFFTIRQDDDGIVRRAALILEHNDQLFTSLALEATKHYLGASEEPLQLEIQPIANAQTITHANIAGQRIRTDATGQILIPYLGRARTFQYISATQVLNNQPLPDLTDAITIIGTSAQALADLRTTPLQPSYPGVEIQATLIHALLNPEQIPYTPEWQDGAMVSLMAALCLIMILLFPLLRPAGLIFSGALLLLAVIAFNIWLWLVPRINLDLILPLLLIIAISTLFVLHRLLREHNERQRIHGMFGQYVPVDHIDHMLDDQKAALSMEGERREMSVLFSDIRNFTSISEHLSTQQLKQFLNHYLTPITAIIFDQQGTIDKYIGDLVMAFWGAPLDDPQHAEHAVAAALKMRKKTEAMQEEFRQLGLEQPVTAGIGIHSGEMNVGDMGSAYRRAYTVLGDAVNLGSRLEGLTKHYRITILVSEDTRRLCPTIYFREIDQARVKGRQEPVRIYEPLGYIDELTEENRDAAKQHELALSAYYEGGWEQAQQLFSQLFSVHHDPLFQVYLERMQTAGGEPPTDWDGIFNHTSK